MTTTPHLTHSTARRQPRFALHDRVMTRYGEVGTIVKVYSPYEYEVAFDEPDETGEWVQAVRATALLPCPEEPPPQA